MSFRSQFRAWGNAGFSILEGIVGAAVGGLVIYGVSVGMLQSLRLAKSVEMKSDVNNFHQLVSLRLANSNGCKEMLPQGFSIPSQKLPAKGGGACDPATCTVEVPSLQIGADSYQANTRYGENLKFSGARLVLGAHRATITSGQEEYDATLKYTLARSGQAGFAAYDREFPLLIQFSKSDPAASSVNLSSCFGIGATNTGAETCEKMGGTWLSNSQGSEYFPRERCHFGGSIELSSTEWPDTVPIDGTTSQDGIRLESCRYMASTAITSYACPGFRAGKTAGWLCRYDKQAKQWKKAYFSKTSTGDNAGQLIFTSETICSKGVTASKSSDMVTYLDFDETLAGAFAGTSGSGKSKYFSSSTFGMQEFLEEADRLHTVLRCRTDQNKDLWFDCLNPSDPALARAGGVGSCIYVRGVKVSSLASLGTASTGVNKDNYTGWIKVTGARTFGTVPAPNTTVTNIAEPRLVEATGTPCVELEVNPAAYIVGEFLPGPAARGNDSSPDSVTSADANSLQMRNVSQCLVQLRDKSATPIQRQTILSCAKNATLDGDPNSWTNIIRDTDDFALAVSDLGIDMDPDGDTIPAFRSIEEIDNLISKIYLSPGNAYPAAAIPSPGLNCIPGNPSQNCASVGLRDSSGNQSVCRMTNRLYSKWLPEPCDAPGFHDGLPSGFGNLSQLRATIYTRMQALTTADPDALGLQNCGYFKYTRVTGYADAQFTASTTYPASGQKKSDYDAAGKIYSGFYNAGASPTSTWLASSGVGSTANFSADLKGAFTGWLFLKSAVPLWFRTESGTLRSDYIGNYRTLLPSGTDVPIFVQIENLAGALFPPVAAKNRAWNAYYPLNTGTTSFNYGTPPKSVPHTRPTIALPGIPCNMGIRTKTR